jgi:hypothetical protein
MKRSAQKTQVREADKHSSRMRLPVDWVDGVGFAPGIQQGKWEHGNVQVDLSGHEQDLATKN